MVQNTGHSVMNQRTESLASPDDFPTQPWATRALCEFLTEQGRNLSSRSVFEPACGRGTMMRPLAESFRSCHGADAFDYGKGYPVANFLDPEFDEHLVDGSPPDWIVTNPPFKNLDAFAQLSLQRARQGVALFCRLTALETIGRHNLFFAEKPVARRVNQVLVFSERVPLVRARLDPKASTATAYCWLIWTDTNCTPDDRPVQIHWTRPGTRARLEREGDYSF